MKLLLALLFVIAVNATTIYGISLMIDHRDDLVDAANDYLDMSEGE